MAAMGHHLSRSKSILDSLRHRRNAKRMSMIVGAKSGNRSPVCFVDLENQVFDFEVPDEMEPAFHKLQGKLNRTLLNNFNK